VGDELELIAAWAVSKLKPGGPDRVRAAADPNAKRTTVDGVAAAVRAFLADAGASWSGSKQELAQQVALWCVEHAFAGLCPLTTLRRALAALKDAGALIHDVVHDGRTWRSTWRLEQPPTAPTTEISGEISIPQPRGQKGESTWAPGLPSSPLPIRERLLPAGGSRGGG